VVKGEEMQMRMMRYYTTAAWLRGYVSSLDPKNEVNRAVIAHLTAAEQLLQDIWDKYAKQEGL
jgi:hypothetical protein